LKEVFDLLFFACEILKFLIVFFNVNCVLSLISSNTCDNYLLKIKVIFN